MSFEKWDAKKAWEWYDEIPFILGFNYVPSTAVNSTEMWQENTFDEATIERELGFASDIGFNSCRIFIQYIVWKYDAEGLKQRIDRFLEIASKKKIRTMIILFDDCNFDNRQPFFGQQPDPVIGVHNSRWTPSPGEELSSNLKEWVFLEKYIKDIVGHFATDERVLIWDLYNEPGNCGMAGKTVSLLKAAFEWARQINPMQPLTSGAWSSKVPCDTLCYELSDIISFHNYSNINATEKIVDDLKKFGRPIFCTEWLHRPNGNRIETHLPLFKKEKIGIFNWGLVIGKTQTHLSWNTMHGAPDPNPTQWQHDLLQKDGSPYSEDEINLLKEFANLKRID